MTKAPAVSASGVRWWQILSWQMYDFADTIYSMNIYTFYFGLFLASQFGRSATEFSLALTLANLVVAITSPLLGALSDASQRRLPFLRFFATCTFVSTALIAGATSYAVAVALFVVSYFCYSTASNFYQALLPGLCTEQNVSRVSGGGVALGYVGTIVGLGAMMPLIKGEADYWLVFPASALLFFLFALPCLIFVPDFAPNTQRTRFDLAAAFRRVTDTVTHARQYAGLFRFLVADFIYENAVAAVFGSMVVYSSKVVGFAQSDLQTFLMFSTAFAILFGYIFGPIVDKIGPKRSVLIMLSIWFVVLPAVALARTVTQFRFLGPLVGIGLAATWISSRTFLVALAPVHKSGEFFGLYSLSGKSAGVLGQGVWTLVLFLLVDRVGEVSALRTAVWTMWGFILVGALMVLTLPDVRPTRANVLDRVRRAD